MTEPQLTIQETTFTFDDFIDSVGVSRKVAEEVLASDLVMIPTTDFREFGVPLFPNLSEEVYDFIARNNSDGTQISVCIDDENYQELILHHSVLHVATWVGKTVLLPLLGKWVVDFVKSKWGDPSKTEVHFKMIVTDKKKEIEYTGPASEMNGALLEAVKTLGSSHEE